MILDKRVCVQDCFDMRMHLPLLFRLPTIVALLLLLLCWVHLVLSFGILASLDSHLHLHLHFTSIR